MKKVFIGSLFLLLVVLSDICVGGITRKVILNVPDVGVNQTNSVQALFHRKADVLVLGPSTANHHYDTRLLRDSLRMSVYNAGFDGKNIQYSAMVFYSFLQRCKPKIVCLDLGPSMLSDEWNGSIGEMNIFYNMSPVVHHIINERATSVQKIKLCSNLYQCNNSWQWLLHAYLQHGESTTDGYRPLDVVSSNQFGVKHMPYEQFRVDSVNLRYLDEIVNKCKQRGVKIIFSVSPSLIVTKRSEFERWIRYYAARHGVDLLDLQDDERFLKHPTLFYDYTHLNRQGAVLFSQIIVDHIRQSMKKASQ